MIRSALTCAAVAGVLSACGGDLDSDAEPVVARYSEVVRTSYALSVTSAEAMGAAITAFIAAPSDATLTAAKTAWKTARTPYGETEVFRFYEGPIDNAETGLEGQINAWPLDEVYIDYTDGSPTGGIVNDSAVTIDKATLIAKNELGGEKNIATGWHAIEFLLWGQDLSATGPGARPVSDFVGSATTAAGRRRQYLEVSTALLLEDLKSVQGAWAAGAAYPTALEAEEAAASLEKILLGMGSLAGAELSGERMTVAYDNRDQEDEHSCFSDNTYADLIANAKGIENVWLGRVGGNDGAGLDDLVRDRDAALADKLTGELAAALTALAAIPQPFDAALLDDANGRPKVLAAINALKASATTMGEVATLLGITLTLE